MSFKASTNHEFGVIYYDEREDTEGSTTLEVFTFLGSPLQKKWSYGRRPSHIRIKFESNAPDWAHYYKISVFKKYLFLIFSNTPQGVRL